MFRLFDKEGICDATIPRAYYDAFQIAIGHGDEARAKIFAEGAYATRMIVEGDGSPEVIKLKRLAEQPTEHCLYGMFMDPSDATNSSQQVDDEDLEDWLWREGKWSEDPAALIADDPSDIPDVDPWLGIRKVLAEEGWEIESSDSLSTN